MNSIMIKFVSILCMAVFNITVLADQYPSTRSTIDQDYYGVVDGIYAQESRIVIDDTSFSYNHLTKFENARGVAEADVWDAVEQGEHVKYHVLPISNQLLLVDLTAISEQEFVRATEREYE